MKVAELKAFGEPSEVVDCVEAPDVGAPDPGEVVIEIAACPINPADLLIIEGRYATRPALPARLGIEGAGRIVAVGSAVERLAVGDPVMSLARANWAQRLRVKAGETVRLPAEVDLLQAAMLKANAATAHLMLRDYVKLGPEDWVIQNAANSGVGADLIRLARRRGLRTVNVVRRASAVEPLRLIGGDVVLVDGEDLAARVRAETGGAAIKLAVDAIGGSATLRLADCLAEGGVVVNYGFLSGEPCQVAPEQTVFRDITLRGFWLAKLMRETPPAEIQALYAELAGRLADGTLQVEVEATYPLERIKEALAHAGRAGRRGKVLLAPNGPVG